MSILVTGGAGFIGSHTCVELLNAGYDVVVVDNLYNASKKALDRVEQITGKKVTFYEADILDRDALNTGVPDAEKMRACVISGERANELGIPVVLDPVGAGASAFRLRELEKLTHSVRMALIRCNQEEAKALLHIWNGASGGVESGVTESVEEQTDLARKLTEAYRCAVLVSGPRDVVAEVGMSEVLTGGDARLSRITGGGCMLSALCALLCGAEADPWEAARTAGALWRSCAEWADRESRKTSGGIGTFHMRLFDAVERYFYRST